MRTKGTKNKKYSYEFKLSVILDMRNNQLSYNETVKKHCLGNIQHGGARQMLQRWERIFLEEGAKGLMKERRGKSSNGVMKGRPPKLDKSVEEDLISENQRLRMENEYLKKLIALVQSEEENEKSTKYK
jgi:transposase